MSAVVNFAASMQTRKNEKKEMAIDRERESTTIGDLLASFNLEAQSGTLRDFLAPKPTTH